MNKKHLVLSLSFIVSFLYGETRVFLSSVENESDKTLYKVYVPSEKYEFLLPPHTKKVLGSWVNLQERPDIYLGIMKGDGEPIFLDWGPESSGECDPNALVQSFIYWAGEQRPPSSYKNYLTCCLNKEKVELGLKIHPDGKPDIFVIDGATELSRI
jgi:hypothetical protein